jgi:hypothetical protein
MNWACNGSGYVNTTTLGYYNTSTNLTVLGDVVFNMGCSNYPGTLLLTLSMCNLAPTHYYRMETLSNITSISHGTLTEVTHNTIPCIQFPGTLLDYISLSTQINTYTSGSICLLADANFSGGFTCNLMYILNPGDTANAFQYDITAGHETSYDRITLGGAISNTTTCNYDNTKWHFITTTFSNYTINYSNFFDFYYYYDSVKQGSFVSNVGHTSSLIGPTLVLGQYYPGYVAHLGVFDRCLCKREIEIYSDIMFSSNVPLNSVTYLTPGTYSWTVPSGVTSITITLNGAGGGSVSGGSSGGAGGIVTGTYTVYSGYTYTIIVGGTGTYGGTGGSSGGGYGYNGGAGGGGYTAFAYSGTNIVIVGGGGGGGTGFRNDGGNGGDTIRGGDGSSGGGTAATGGSTSNGTGAQFSSQNGGNGTSLTGGNARSGGKFSGGGGGGAGYYGGGGGATPAQSGAGGSSFIDSGFTASVDAQGGGSGSDIDGSVSISW